MDRCRICYSTFLNLEILGDTQEKQFLEELFTRKGVNEQLDGCYLICYECKFLLKKTCKFIEKALKAQQAYLILQCHENDHANSWENLINNELISQSTLSYHKAEITLFLKENESLLDENEVNCSDFLNDTDTATFTDNKNDFVDRLTKIKEPNKTKLPDNNDEDAVQDDCDTGNEEEAFKAENNENDEQYANNNDNIIAISSDEGDSKSQKTKKIKKTTYSDSNNKSKYNSKKQTPRQKKVFNYKTDKEDDTVISNENQSVNSTDLYLDVALTERRRSMRGKKIFESENKEEYTLTERERRMIARNNVESEDDEEISLKERLRRMKTGKHKESKKRNTGNKKYTKKNDEDEEFMINSEISDSESDDELADSYDDNGKIYKKPPRKYPRKCDHCDFEVESVILHYHHYLITHGSDMYPYQKKEIVTKKFVCQHCGCKKRMQSELKAHEKIHSGKKDYLCPNCGKAFYSNKSLRNHIYAVHEEKRHFCNYCNKGFQSRADLIRHVRTHTGEKPFQCKICKTSYATFGNLTSHLRKGHQQSNNDNNTVSRKRKKKIPKKPTHQDTDSNNVSDGEHDIALAKRKKKTKKVNDQAKLDEDMIKTTPPCKKQTTWQTIFVQKLNTEK
ncbi:hypothetical protein O0L34_g18980 [Tuta absoluta]|nr:hypothetical protein O0L34_g18980 [Tuta absoluta]